ncbi:MAG: LytTR family transcriptional regulator DNA-binding domain-containing protein [Saprospiraceae bacterium]|nr:LytTR family transcriptional regulator DNA-binding domain-containing protein [Saprospiraceae bacterium]
MTPLQFVTKTDNIFYLNIESKIKKENSALKSLVISNINGLEMVDLNKIIYFKAESNYTRIFMLEDRVVLAPITLMKYETKLESTFIRIHKSYLINPLYIRSFCLKNSKLLLHNNSEIPVSRRKKSVLKAYFKSVKI